MPSVIPPVLVSYFSNTTSGSLTLITSVLAASSTWLTLRHIHAALCDIDEDSLHVSDSRLKIGDNLTNGRRVVFVSFLRSLHLWREQGKRVGLDLPKLISTKRILYVDGLDYDGLHRDTNTGGQMADFVSSRPEEIELAIRRATSHNSRSTGGLTLIIDGIDFLLASNSNLTAINLSQLLLGLLKDFDHLVVGCSADAPLIHSAAPSASSMEREHKAFITTVAHQSLLIMQLRNLDTGAAKDVSGILRISRGGIPGSFEKDGGVQDGEWLYQVKGDGSVRVWSRGE